MSLTKEQANLRLEQISTPEELRDLVRELDVTGTGRVTLLWSGSIGTFGSVGAEKIASQIVAASIAASNSDFRILTNTEAGRFLDLDRASPTFNSRLSNKLEEIFVDRPDELRNFLYGQQDPGTKKRIGKGAWDIVSENFAAQAKGNVRLIVGGGGDDRIFAQTELPALLRNPEITSIEGIPINGLREMARAQGTASVLKLLRLASDVTSGMLKVEADSTGRPVINPSRSYNIDATDYVNMRSSPAPTIQGMQRLMDYIPKERKIRHALAVKEIYKTHRVLARQGHIVPRKVDPFGLPNIISRVGSYGGRAIDVLSVGTMIHKSTMEMRAGDHEAAHDTVVTWAAEATGSFIVGRLATTLVAPLMMTGPVGFLVGAGIIIGASILGGEIGKKLVRRRNKIVETIIVEIFIIGSPLVLDLEEFGIETLALHETIIYFDHDNNNFVEKTGWVGPNEGLLILDLNGNGKVDSGAELFGNNTVLQDGQLAADGFVALAMYDHNADERLDYQDAIWQELRVWRDQNSNAETDPDEWFTLDDLRVKSLLLAHHHDEIVDANGNVHLQHGFYESIDGNRRIMTDVWFAKDTMNSIPTTYREVDEETAELPDVPGIGILPSLHQALMDPSNPLLKPLLLQWLNATRQERIGLSEALLFQWCDAMNNPYKSADRYIYNDDDPKLDLKLAVFEKMMGDRLVTDEFVLAINRAERVGSFSDQMTLSLDMILHHEIAVKPLFELAVPVESDDFGPFQLDLTASVNHLRTQFLKDPDPGFLPMIQWLLLQDDDIGQTFFGSLQSLSTAMADPFQRAMRLQREVAKPWEWIRGTSDHDQLKGTAENDFLEAGPGYDHLWGNDGDDTLHGSSGSNAYYGGNGGDTYIVSQSDGVFVNTIFDQSSEQHGLPDRIVFWDIASHQLRPIMEGDDLAFYPSKTFLIGESLSRGIPAAVIQKQERAQYQIEEFHFSDGVIWSHDDLLDRIKPQGTSVNDQLIGVRTRNNHLLGLGGHDILIGGMLSDDLNGGPGQDSLTGFLGNDTLNGGPGNDYLNGGEGNDTYILTADSGHDQIYDIDHGHTSRDTIHFPHFKPRDLRKAIVIDQTVKLHFASGASLTILNQLNPTCRIEWFAFDNGDLWSHEAIMKNARSWISRPSFIATLS